MRKKHVLLFFVMMMFVCLCSVHVFAADVTEVTLYGLDSSDKEKVIIPPTAMQSYQITVGAGQSVTYRVTQGSSVKVSSTGLVTPSYTYWKKSGYISVSVSEGQPYDYYTINDGDSVVTATVGNTTYTFNIHVKDYTIAYCDQVMDTYIANHIRSDMTDMELLTQIVKFPASYDYSAYYSSVYGMIVNGGGDCWASVSAILKLCEKLEITAWARNGNKDSGAGSGHRNALVELNGTVYELEAGYSMPKNSEGFRPYSVIKRDSLFCYRDYGADNKLNIYQYDAREKTGKLVIPSTINEKVVGEISKSTFASGGYTEVVMSYGLETIGDFAFSACRELEKVVIPATVSKIGSSAFCSCYKLTDIQLAEDNPYFSVVNGTIYTKDMKTLVMCPNAATVEIPSTVTEIADYAFYYNKNITSIVIPSSVEKIGEGAFGDCNNLTSVTFEGAGLKNIGNHAFRDDTKLKVIRLPETVEAVGAYAFAYCNNMEQVYFYGDAPSFGGTIEGNFYDNVFSSCKATIYYPKDNATWTAEVLAGHGGTGETVSWTVKDSAEKGSDETQQDLPGDSKDSVPEQAITPVNDGQINETGVVSLCSFCDSQSGLIYSSNKDKIDTVTVVGVDVTKIGNSITVPNKIVISGNTYKVTGVGAKAFKSCSKIKKIALSSNVVSIGKEAFKGCKKLNTLTIKSKKLSSKTVAQKAFKDISAKTTIKVPSKQRTAYKKLFKKKGLSGKTRIM